MTIILSWWALPLIIVIAGFTYAMYDSATTSGWFAGINGILVFIASLVAAIGIIIGHFL